MLWKSKFVMIGIVMERGDDFPKFDFETFVHQDENYK